MEGADVATNSGTSTPLPVVSPSWDRSPICLTGPEGLAFACHRRESIAGQVGQMRHFEFWGWSGGDEPHEVLRAQVWANDEEQARSTLRAHINGFLQAERLDNGFPGPSVAWVDHRLRDAVREGRVSSAELIGRLESRVRKS